MVDESDRELVHLDARGQARMVDVGDKPRTRRVAVAEAFVRLGPATLDAVERGTAKGDALAVARIAGLAATKKTADLIPLCHPLSLTHAAVDLRIDRDRGGVRVETRVETTGPTGVEMEALTAASVAALALYDMVKKMERGATIEGVRIVFKEGGASGRWQRSEELPLGTNSESLTERR